MHGARKSEEQLFEAARDLKTLAERNAYLDTACAGDPDLRRRVEGLLAADASAGSFFADGASALNQSALDLATAEQPGDRIGRYELQQKIGEGGCGVVFMAEQHEPIRRKVALKVIKLGMDTKSVIGRFEAERQALALMDHPNIAKVLDGGATDTGRPFFVMELVRGLRITEYCDEQKLSTHARLALFAQVCHAIQHAHQKGIIHRDIKPSNILVTTIDGAAIPKVIDFGIAKATNNQRLTDRTLFTAFEQFIGTPAYMSPEQAEMSGVDADTRADIYSLGVLLYELLTGCTPFDQKELLAAGLDEMRRTIREEDPPRPSTRLSTMAADTLTTAARHRHSEPPKLIHQVRGDLDWIVMKCLEKDRSRRYQTANGLATDLKRYLTNEPVSARPPSRAYQLQKLVRRNRVAFAALAAVAAALVIGLSASAWMFFREKTARSREASMRQRAEEAERRMEQQLYSTLVQQARVEARSAELGHRSRALEAIRRAVAISNTVELRREAVAALTLHDLQFERELAIPSDALAVFDPEFARVAICDDTNAVEIRSITDRRLLVTMSPSTNYASVVSDK
ncbi:MAG: serine/threonine protein kinase [Verrucomicrobia subdivision 3 bacterium]|nr:serine/threonine protein kinase [Limisphaerales bacterium]